MENFNKSYFKNFNQEQVKGWIDKNKQTLIGSAIFTKSDTIVSKIICRIEWLKCENKSEFVPSHTGSIVEKDGEIYIFDMKPPKASVQKLEKYILSTSEDFVIILRNFDLDTKMFSLNILDHENQKYPYLSAVKSIFSKKDTKWNTHCSELHLRQLQIQGIKTDMNPEITPDELYHELLR